MKVYQTNEIKNISILGSSGSGKTTLAEAMLYEGGVIKRRGSTLHRHALQKNILVNLLQPLRINSILFLLRIPDH